MASSWVATRAKRMRSTVAARTPIEDRLAALFLGQAGGGEADHDRIVACEHEVDHDHGEERLEGFQREEFHVYPALHRPLGAEQGAHISELAQVFKRNRRRPSKA